MTPARALKVEEHLADDIDMDRVIVDADYRRWVIARLRRERLLKAQVSPVDDGEAAADDD